MVAIINLVLLYQSEQTDISQSYAIIKTGDLKVHAESISGFAISVASGNVNEKVQIKNEIENTELILKTIKTGGMLDGQPIEKTSQTSEYNKVSTSWNTFKEKALSVQETSVFDKEATNAVNYILQKNNELVLTVDGASKEISSLDRDYNKHKEIINELEESAKKIGQITLLISAGDESNTQKTLTDERIKFQTGLQKLISATDTSELGNNELAKIPRENSGELRKLDPLWESMKPKINILEERSLLSPNFNSIKNEMNVDKKSLFLDIDDLLKSMNSQIKNENNSTQTIIQILLIVDIAVFILVLYIIRQSLLPLRLITNALSEIKEGEYGKKIEYSKADEMGELVNTFNIMSDTIQEKEENAKKTDIAKDEFLAMITHELKTPLVPIQGYADILLSEHLGKLTDKQRERINIIKSSSETLLSLISDLLDAQKLDLGQLRMKKEMNNIKETILSVVGSFSPQAQKNKITIISNVQDLSTEYDDERIKQVLSNLIKNSMNAVRHEKGVIEIITKNLPQVIQVSVKDNGIGIPVDKQMNLFKKFYQVDTSLTREKSGSGLGLAICKGIIETHGGEITVTSIQNHETVFTFTLPKTTESGRSPIGIA